MFPVGKFLLIVSADLSTTVPVTVITLSRERFSKIGKYSFEESTTI